MARPFTQFPEAFLAVPHAGGGTVAPNIPELDLAPTPLKVVLFIAATPRVGSNLLGDDLRQTCRAGVPLEYLNFRMYPGTRERSRRWHYPSPRLSDRARQATRLVLRDPEWATVDHSADRVADYLRTVASFRTTPNGVFTIKAHWAHFEPLVARNGLDVGLWGVPVVWVWLDREDRLGQAISFARAQQSGEWADFGREGGTVPTYDAVAIRSALEAMELGRQGWERYFADEGISPIAVSYEAFVADREAVVRRIIEAVDPGAVLAATDLGRSTLRRQSDGISAEWRVRFEAEEAGNR